MSVMVIAMTKLKLVTLSELVQRMNEFFDTNPEFHKTPSCEVNLKVSNPDFDRDNGGYDDLIIIFACERYIRFKLRDSKNLIEYDLSCLPWRGGFNLNIWYDGKTSHIDRSSNQAINAQYLSTEEEYFQASTVLDYRGVTLGTIKEIVKLQDRMYNYFGLVPVPFEKDGGFV